MTLSSVGLGQKTNTPEFPVLLRGQARLEQDPEN